MAALPRLLPLLLLLLAASSAALLATSAHSSCSGPLAIPCIPRSCSRPLSLRSVGLRVRAPARGAWRTRSRGRSWPDSSPWCSPPAAGDRAPRTGAQGTLRPPGPHTGCAHSSGASRNAPGLQLPAEPRAATGPKCTCPSPQPCRPSRPSSTDRSPPQGQRPSPAPPHSGPFPHAGRKPSPELSHDDT